MEVLSKPCQDRFLHPVLVHYRKNKKIQVAKWGTPKKIVATVLDNADLEQKIMEIFLEKK